MCSIQISVNEISSDIDLYVQLYFVKFTYEKRDLRTVRYISYVLGKFYLVENPLDFS